MTRSTIASALLGVSVGFAVGACGGTPPVPAPPPPKPPTADLTDVNAVLLDDSRRALNGEFELKEPIPRSIRGLEFSFAMPLEHESERKALAQQLFVRHDGLLVPHVPQGGGGQWSDDGKSVLFLLADKLAPGAGYEIGASSTAALELDIKAFYWGEATFSVAIPGDVNGDGFADLAVGAPAFPDRARAGSGYVHVFAGGEKAIGSCDLASDASDESGAACNVLGSLRGSGENALGASVSNAGDINADGFDDLVVGAPRADDARGRVYIVLGDSGGLGECHLDAPETCPRLVATIVGASPGDMLGSSVAIAGDTNCDGFDDVLIGAVNAPSETLSGEAYLFHGAASGLANCDLNVPAECAGLAATISGQRAGERLGERVAAVGDLNHDRCDDIAIAATSAPCCDANGAAPGEVYVLFGSKDAIQDCQLGAGCTPAIIRGGSAGDLTGAAITGGADLTGDGVDDLLVGAPGASGTTEGDGAGVVYLFSGGNHGVGDCDLATGCVPAATFVGETSGARFGSSLAVGGDMNDDGVSGWWVGSPGFGRVYSFAGTADSPGAVIVGRGMSAVPPRLDGFGKSLLGAHDYDGDGTPDLALGADETREQGATSGPGRVYVLRSMGTNIATPDCDLADDCERLSGIVSGKRNEDQFGTVD